MASLGKRGKPLPGQSREIIYNVFKYFVTEADRFKKNEDENVSCHFMKVQERVANATGISRRTLNNILNEVSTETHSAEIKFSTPKKGRPKKQFRLDKEKSAPSNSTMTDTIMNPSSGTVETEKDDNIEEKLATSNYMDAMMECRSCLARVQEDACVDVFCAWNPPWPGMGLSIAEDLAKLAGIQISVSDPHSKKICETCCTMLENAISFMLSIQNSNILLRNRLKHSFTEASSWPKPIQIDKNIANDALQDMEMGIENIKQEVVSEDEYDNDACNDISDTRLETLDIKIEPEELIQQNILIEVNNSPIQPLEENQTSIPNGDAETHAGSGQVKAAMTRTYNKKATALPYAPAAVKRGKPRDEDNYDDNDDVEEEADSDPENDALIKKKKVKDTEKASSSEKPSTSKGMSGNGKGKSSKEKKK